jgi:opacity protein-like surface antigen
MSFRSFRPLALPSLACSALLCAAPVQAQDKPSIEITPFLGYDFGGSFDVFDFEFGRVNFELQDGESYGVIVDFPISRTFQVEAMAFRQPTTLEIDEGFFGPSFELSDLDIDYLQAGLLWQGSLGQAKPFFTAGAGLARLNPDIPELDSETRFAFNLGGGVKTFFTPHFGLRFEGRLLVITLPEDNEELFCCRGEDDALSQGHVALGFIFAF